MKINKKVTEQQWFDFDKKVKFLIRPFPFSSLKEQGTLEVLKEQFMYCVVAWEGLEDEEKSTAKKTVPFKCNEENKLFLYDFSESIRNFIWEKILELDQKLSEISKN